MDEPPQIRKSNADATLLQREADVQRTRRFSSFRVWHLRNALTWLKRPSSKSYGNSRTHLRHFCNTDTGTSTRFQVPRKRWYRRTKSPACCPSLRVPRPLLGPPLPSPCSAARKRSSLAHRDSNLFVYSSQPISPWTLWTSAPDRPDLSALPNNTSSPP